MTESATLRRSTASPAQVLALLALAAAAWVLTVVRMDGMDEGPGTDLGGLGWFIGVWLTMMAAMMLPSVAPMVATYARERRGRTGAAAVFVAGYLIAWGAAGLLGYAIVEGVRSLDLGVLAWNEAGRYVAGGVILAAALYQLSPLKDVCLRNCRSPSAFFGERRRADGAGALRTGIAHGAYCVGCCSALMAALLALGVMSIGWMVFIAAIIAVEKLLPWGVAARRGVAVLLLVLGIAVAAAPADVPGLTLPGSHDHMPPMGMERH